MPHSRFGVCNLTMKSALQLTLWPSHEELRELVAGALTAFGTDRQADDLRRLGQDFIRYLAFDSAELEGGNYPGLSGFQITHSVLSVCDESRRMLKKRTSRILTSESTGPILRGFGDNDHSNASVIVFSHLSERAWEKLARALNWDPNDLSKANAPGITFHVETDPEMSLLSPPYWA